MSILEIQQLTKAYHSHQALKGITFAIPRGTIFGLLGPNGAGKTTLLRIINQIIQADSGTILFDNQPLAPKHIARIGYLPEERGLYKKMKVGEQLMYLGQLKGLSAAAVKDKLRYWNDRFAMHGWWKKSVSDLSKGMQQKVQFISTVLHEPELIILDEPFSGFDPVNADLIQEVILEFRDRGHTILFSTHRMESVEELCQALVLIHQGELILEGTKAEIKARYRPFIYELLTDAPLVFDQTPAFDILGIQPEDGRYRTQVRIQDAQHTGQDLIAASIAQTTVWAFQEQMPRIHEIFVRLVQGQD
ncbi:MAG: ABC transporter ATP-binding protein [Bernardetiaceae bacterium]